MKTTLIIALTSLITLNANAATFVMQAHTPKGVQVMEGNKGSETPVEQETAQPEVQANFILLTNPEFKGEKVGYYDNLNCILNQTQTVFGTIMNEYNAGNFVVSELDTNGFSFSVHNGTNGVRYKTNYDVVIPELVADGYEAYAGHSVDSNGVIYFFDDLNANKVQDAGERSFYIGAQFSWYDEGSGQTNNVNGVCIKPN